MKTYFSTEQPFDATKAYTNEFLDASIKMAEAVAKVDGLCTQAEAVVSAIPKD